MLIKIAPSREQKYRRDVELEMVRERLRMKRAGVPNWEKKDLGLGGGAGRGYSAGSRSGFEDRLGRSVAWRTRG